MRPICIFLTIICLLAQGHVHAQDQMPVVELQRYLAGKVWALEKECIGDSCYTVQDNSYYWADTFFDGYHTDGSRKWCFILQHAYYFQAIGEQAPSLRTDISAPRICVLGVNSGSTVYTIHRSSGTGTYQLKLAVFDDDYFTIHGPAWGSSSVLERYRAITPPQEVQDLVSQSLHEEAAYRSIVNGKEDDK